MHAHHSVNQQDLPDLGQEVEFLSDAINTASRVAILTGAGVSTECGVPDFRSPGSPWMVNKPIPLAAFLADPAVRVEAWRRKFIMDAHFEHARPGRAHQALATLVLNGKARGIITQNIDDLHGRSGLPPDQIIELHGNGTYATCLDCGQRHELHAIKAALSESGKAPTCEECDGPVKSATISFGQAMPEAALRRALDWSIEADLFLAIGSSLRVNPAARLPSLASRAGARIIIINREETPLDSIAERRLASDIGSLLAAASP